MNDSVRDDRWTKQRELINQVEDAKREYQQATEALRQQLENSKQKYHDATDENRPAALAQYIDDLNAFNALVEAGGSPEEFEPARNSDLKLHESMLIVELPVLLRA